MAKSETGNSGNAADFPPKGQELQLLFASWQVPECTEEIPVAEAAGRIAAQDVFSVSVMPVLRASVLDGIAVDAARFANGIPDTSAWRLGVDYAFADTGDDFDDAFNAVIRLEDVEFMDAGLRIAPRVTVQAGKNMRGMGGLIRPGDLLVRKYRRLTPKNLARLLSGGIDRLQVLRKPRVAVIPSGNELIPFGTPLTRGKYIETNSLFLRETLKNMGAEPICFPIVRDELPALKETLDEALRQADIAILTGGTSRGQKDRGRRLLQAYGQALCQGQTALRDKPVRIALIDNKPVINLPGPPEALYRGVEWCVSGVVLHFLRQPQPLAQRIKVALTDDVRAPESMPRLLKMEITRAEDGRLLATPVNTREMPTWRFIGTKAQYMTRIGGEFLPKGSEIEVELLYGLENIA